MFIRLGTPSGLRITSTGVPSSRNGMSSSGTILEITPLLPWRPASLSPSEILRFLATNTRTRSLTPGDRSSPAARLERLDVDDDAALAVRDLQRRVADLARLLLEDRADQLLLGRQLGLALRRDLADQQVARRTSAPMRTIPRSSRLRSDSSERFGMSRVISSSPSLVVRASTSYSSMWIEVSSSSLTRRRDEDDRVLEVVALPGHEGDAQVLAQRHLALVRRRAVGEQLALADLLAGLDHAASGGSACPGWSA